MTVRRSAPPCTFITTKYIAYAFASHGMHLCRKNAHITTIFDCRKTKSAFVHPNDKQSMGTGRSSRWGSKTGKL